MKILFKVYSYIALLLIERRWRQATYQGLGTWWNLVRFGQCLGEAGRHLEQTGN